MTTNSESLIEWLKQKPDFSSVMIKLISEPNLPDLLLEIIETDSGNVKFYCDKLIQRLSQDHPEIIVPFFDRIASHLKHPNHFIQWGALLTLPNVMALDGGEKFMSVTPTYFELTDGDSMITASNAAKGIVKLIPFHPELEEPIIIHLIHCEDRVYRDKTEVSPECRNIMIGHVIDLFSQLYASSSHQALIRSFVLRHTNNPRSSTAKKAKVFLIHFPT